MAETNVVISKLAQRGAALSADCGKMCGDCAFRTGSDANNDIGAVEAAMECLTMENTFNCHTSNFKDAGTVCAGFLYAKKYLSSPQFYKDLKHDRDSNRKS